MNWAVQQRQTFIKQCLAGCGFVNRADLCVHFGISVPQASLDLQRFLRANPNVAVYNSRSKRYERTGGLMLRRHCCDICLHDTPHKHQMSGRWIGVDFDGTLARNCLGRKDPYKLGPPIAAMVQRVKRWLAAGYEVRLFTARMCEISHTAGQRRDVVRMKSLLQAWSLKHIGVALECTNAKDGAMEVLWDDRAVQPPSTLK